MWLNCWKDYLLYIALKTSLRLAGMNSERVILLEIIINNNRKPFKYGCSYCYYYYYYYMESSNPNSVTLTLL